MGSNIIIEHPYLYERHVLAREVSRTAKTITVRYWDARKKAWKDEESRCKLGPIVPLPDMDDATLQKTSEQLVSFSSELTERQKKARVSYHDKVKALANG